MAAAAAAVVEIEIVAVVVVVVVVVVVIVAAAAVFRNMPSFLSCPYSLSLCCSLFIQCRALVLRVMPCCVVSVADPAERRSPGRGVSESF